MPLVYCTTELIFGRTVPDLSRSWDSLKGWQRGVIGIMVVVGIFSITMAIALAMVIPQEAN